MAENPVQVTIPWRVVDVQDGERLWLAVIDPERNEICRIATTGDQENDTKALAFGRMITALPWLMAASKRTLDDLNRMSDLKNGVTVRQWVRNHEGYKRRIELEDAVERAWKGSTKTPPSSYGLVTSGGNNG